MFIEHQIGILEGFLRDHVTLNIGIMAAKNLALSSQKLIAFQILK